MLTTVGLDLANYLFPLHRADVSERAVLRRKLAQGQVLEVLAGLPRGKVAMKGYEKARF